MLCGRTEQGSACYANKRSRCISWHARLSFAHMVFIWGYLAWLFHISTSSWVPDCFGLCTAIVRLIVQTTRTCNQSTPNSTCCLTTVKAPLSSRAWKWAYIKTIFVLLGWCQHTLRISFFLPTTQVFLADGPTFPVCNGFDLLWRRQHQTFQGGPHFAWMTGTPCARRNVLQNHQKFKGSGCLHCSVSTCI